MGKEFTEYRREAWVGGLGPTGPLQEFYHMQQTGIIMDAMLHTWPSFDVEPSTLELYDRISDAILGDPSAPNDDVPRRCFNCGELGHTVPNCTVHRDQGRVSLARQEFEAERVSISPWMFKATSFDAQCRRLAFIDAFIPGQICGETLRDALGLRDGDPGENVPWLSAIAAWGYPPGWVASTDPLQFLRCRVEDLLLEPTVFDDDDSNFVIFGDVQENLDLKGYAGRPLGTILHERANVLDELCVDSKLVPTIENTLVQSPLTKSPSLRRWAIYPQTYFLNDVLPVFNGVVLPPLRIDMIQESMSPQPLVMPPPPPSYSPPPLPPSPLPPASLERQPDTIWPFVENKSEDSEEDMDLSDVD